MSDHYRAGERCAFARWQKLRGTCTVALCALLSAISVQHGSAQTLPPCDPALLFLPPVRAADGFPGGDRIVTGDFTGDQLTDVVRINRDGGIVMSPGVASPRGSFGTPRTSAGPPRPQDVIAADVDGDLRLDLLVLSAQSGLVHLLTGLGSGTTGNGRFAETATFPGLTGARRLHLGDLNGDGISDLLVAGTGGVQIADGSAGSGAGRFGTPRAISSMGVVDAAAGDVDGDGVTDLVLAEAQASRGHLLKGRRSAGRPDGTFEPPLSFATDAPGVRVRVADLDGDGLGDVGLLTAVRLDIFTGASSGAPQLREKISAASASDFEFADVTGDGLPDAAIMRGFAADLLFAAQVRAPGSVLPSFLTPTVHSLDVDLSDLAFGDLDRDRSPDLVLSNPRVEGLLVLRNVCTRPVPGQYVLRVAVQGPGEVARTPDEALYDAGAEVRLEARPTGDSHFVSWLGDVTSPLDSIQVVTMDRDRALTAAFESNLYPLSLDVIGAGRIVPTPSRPAYRRGDRIELQAIPNPGWRFVEWSGDTTGSESFLVLVVRGPVRVTARFEEVQYRLNTLTVFPRGRIEVVPNQATYSYGTPITLTALPPEGMQFVRWSGSFESRENPLRFPIGSDIDLRAWFGFRITTRAEPASGGRVVTDVPGGTADSGSVVRFSASPAAHYRFTGWGGDARGTETTVPVRLDRDVSVVAHFEPLRYPVTVVGSGGTVRVTPDRPDYIAGEQLELLATPGPESLFVGWGGSILSHSNPAIVSVDGPMTISANFRVLTPYQVRVSSVGPGTVSTTPEGERQLEFTPLRIQAIPAPGHHFVRWEGDTLARGNPLTFPATRDRTLRARFAPDDPLRLLQFARADLGVPALDTGSRELLLANLDGDRVPDLVATPGILSLVGTRDAASGRATGGFALAGSVLPSNSVSAPAVVADFDGDGASDLAVRYGISVIAFLRSRGPGIIGRGALEAAAVMERVDRATALLAPDLNGDSQPDLIIGGPGGAAYYRNESEYQFQLLGRSGQISVSHLAMVDIDADGADDLVVGDGTALHTWYRRIDVPLPGQSPFESDGQPLPLPTGGLLATLDLDRDGFTDLVVGGERLAILYGGAGAIESRIATLSLRPASQVGLADLNRDGLPDVAAIHPDGAVAYLARGLGGEARREFAAGAVLGSAVGPLTVGDIDADGAADLIARDPLTGRRFALLSDAGTYGHVSDRGIFLDVIGKGRVLRTPNVLQSRLGSRVQITAIPDYGQRFVRWTGGLAGQPNPASVTITGDLFAGAQFGPDSANVAVRVVGNGSVNASPATERVRFGSTVTLAASAQPGSVFAGWSGGADGLVNPLTLVVQGDVEVTATFVPGTHALLTRTKGEGVVERAPDRVGFAPDDRVTLTARAAPGWGFTRWSGDVEDSLANPLAVRMTRSRDVQANFGELVAVTIDVHGRGTVTRTPDQPAYAAGQTLHLAATPTGNARFAGWSGDAEGESRELTVRVAGPLRVVAQFEDGPPLRGGRGVPRGLAIGGVTPNPSRGAIRLEVGRVSGAAVQVELVDIAGRRVATQHLPAGEAGWSEVTIAPPRDLAPGLYFARVQQGPQSRQVRVVRAR